MRWLRYYLIAVALSWLLLNQPDIWAHHANLTGGQKEFLHSDLPHHDAVVSFRDYTLFLTAIDRAPGTIDILLYLEDTLKRPVFGQRTVVVEGQDGRQVFSGILEPDKTGVFHLRYAYDEPLAARLKVLYADLQVGSSDSWPQWITADIRLGSPAPNVVILVLLGAALLAAVVVVGVKHKGTGQ